MSVPAIVQSQLDGEQVAAQVPLGGEDALFVTRTRTLIYRADGLLSDESVEEYSHEAERIEISEGRRKSAVLLDYGIDGDQKFKIPSNRLYEALHPVLAGVLNAAGVTGPDETVTQTYQFSELTLVITSERVVKHVGAAVWDEDYEEFHFDDVTALEVEEGSVSSQIIIESDDRPQRIKTPSDQTREVRERIQQALLDHYGMSSYEEFASAHAEESDADDADGDDPDAGSSHENDPLAGGVDPIQANPPELDDDGAIVDDDASVTTGERADATQSDSIGASDSTAAEAGTATEQGTTAEQGTAAESSASAGQSSASATEADTAAEATERATEVTEQATERATETTEQAAPATDEGSASDAAGNGELVSEPTDDGVTTGEASDETNADASTGGFADSVFEPASSDLEADSTEEQLEALTKVVERQNELLAEQQRTLETLIEELSRGR